MIIVMKRAMDESKFKESLKESITAQWHNFEFFRNICARKEKTLGDLIKAIDNEEYYQIPAIVTTAFKKSRGLFHDLNDFSQKGVFQVSSSTSGDPSYIYTNQPELTTVADNYSSTFGIEGISRAIAFAPSCTIMNSLSMKERYLKYESVSRMKIALDSARAFYRDLLFTHDVDVFRTLVSKVLNGKPILRILQPEVVTEIISAAAKKQEKISLGGIVLLFVPYLNLMKEGQFNIGSDAYFSFSGGGYSGSKGSIKGDKVDKSAMVKRIASVFGMDKKYFASNIRDIYAFTESSATNVGFWCNEIDEFLFRTWNDSRMYIVDPETEMPLKRGEGIIKIITPYSNGNPSAANVSVLQLDAATIREVKDNFIVTSFSHIRRLKNAGIEGCAFKAEEISRF
jgi:hypothetical protein